MTEIHGHCDDRFQAVKDRFAAHFDEGLEVGATVAVTLHGEPVVDLWAGDADGEGTPWERDTLTNVWSTTKTMAAITMLVLADRGEIDVEAPVADYWPEFKANGKEGVTVAHVLSHTAGLPGWNPAIAPDDLYDWDVAVENLAAEATWWEPGTQSGYHAITQGFLEGEIVRRVTGRSLGTYFREEIAEPLGADFHIGLPESEEHRVAQLFSPDRGIAELEGVDMESLAVRALMSCPLSGDEPNTRAWRAAEIPAAGGQSNARAVARVHSMIANGGEVDGVRLLSPEGIDRIFVERSHNVDLVLGMKMRLGTGFGLINDTTPLSPNVERSCFWGGWGGSLAVIDCELGLSVAYVMNKMGSALAGDLRGAVLALTAIGAAMAPA
jgi:CubicO group peptidase (beta-lactamase class C family)